VPFVKVTLTAPNPRNYTTDPQTLGEHLKKRRRELGLYQKDVALRLKVNEWTYCTWETDKTEPVISMFPRIIDFLGYYPHPAPQSLGERFVAIRKNLGLSRARLAETIGIDEGTVLRIERGKPLPEGECGARINKFLSTIPALL
jgi:DNA-binding XRE family transcriptional regulator